MEWRGAYRLQALRARALRCKGAALSDEKDTPPPIPVAITGTEETRPMPGVPQDIRRVIAAAQTLELHGSPSIAQAALGIARRQVGQRETPGLKNQGPIVEKVARPFLSERRFVETYPKGALQWCSFFACWAVLEALKAAGARPEQVAIWMRIASGSCGALHERLDKLGLVTSHVPGAPIPEGTYFVFFGTEKDGAPDLSHVGIYEATMGQLVCTIEGNSGHKADAVSEGRHMIDDPRLHSTARLPF